MGLFSNKHSIGKTIAALRKEKGWTQIELAENLQVSDKAVSKWEKDNGIPSVEFFPILAELFGVSIDYIMTGKTAEKEIIAMSKLELCAKNDDVSLFKSLPDEVVRNKDDSQKDIIYYIEKYDSKKVFYCLIEKYGVVALTRNYWDRGSLKFDDKKVIELLIKFEFIDELNKIGFFTFGVQSQYHNCPQYYVGEFIEYITNNIPVRSSIVKQILSLHEKDLIKPKNGWTILYEKMLKVALQNNNEPLINVVLPLIMRINKEAVKTNTEEQKHYEKRRQEHYGSDVQRNIAGIVKVDAETLRMLLEKEYLEEAKFLNMYCTKNSADKINDGEIDFYMKKSTGKINEYDVIVLPCVNDGILDVAKVLACTNIAIIKKAFSEYAIHPIESMCVWCKNKNYKKLFEHSIDYKIPYLPEYIAKGDGKKIEEQIISIFKNKQNYWTLTNSKYVNFGGVNPYRRSEYSSVKDILNFFETIKESILSTLKNEIDKDAIIKELNRDYFMAEFIKGNIDIVVVKLCVRLEAILRYSFGYSGTFEEMLRSYCGRFNTYDDEDNDYDPHTPELLQRLRMHRNSIVHSDKTAKQLSSREIESCINHICALR